MFSGCSETSSNVRRTKMFPEQCAKIIRDHITLKKHSIHLFMLLEERLSIIVWEPCQNITQSSVNVPVRWGKKAFVGPHEIKHHMSCVAKDASVSCR